MVVISDIQNFNEDEFSCKCGCGFNDYKVNSIVKLQMLRTACEFPFYINSCCRCKKHNLVEGGSNDSEHLSCDGFDIKCISSSERFTLIYNALILGFNRIGIYKRFVHLGTSTHHAQKVIWHG